MTLSLDNDRYLQPEEPDTHTFKIDLLVSVHYSLTTEIEAVDEEHAKALVEEDRRALIEKTVLSGERNDIEFEIDYISGGPD